MRDTMLTELASRQTTVRRYLEEYHSWICSKLGCRIATKSLTIIRARRLFPYGFRDGAGRKAGANFIPAPQSLRLLGPGDISPRS